MSMVINIIAQCVSAAHRILASQLADNHMQMSAKPLSIEAKTVKRVVLFKKQWYS